ncbi:UNVERIFIED_CONTAM: hypothetical protein K2H54_058979 [Gekko kuhli]
MENAHSLTSDEVLWRFEVRESCELSSEQVQQQREKYGLNSESALGSAFSFQPWSKESNKDAYLLHEKQTLLGMLEHCLFSDVSIHCYSTCDMLETWWSRREP